MTTGIALLGSTGSIGTQTLDVLADLQDQFRLVSIAARSNVALLEEQVRRWQPQVVVAQEGAVVAGRPVLPTPQGLIEAATHPDVDIVVAATSGHDAIPAIIAAIEAGKTIALANKEAIVCAGPLIVPLAKRHNVEIRSVDSEHSAVWQALRSGAPGEIDRLVLTASGGPFRTLDKTSLATVTVEQALAHPNWSMGAKITVDSSTLFNKGLEVIEAHWLFGVGYDKIEVLVHPTQIVHSMIEFIDGSTIAQLSPPDMHLPIQYALTYPHRRAGSCARLDLASMRELTFEPPDLDRFPALRIAYEAGRRGDSWPTVLSAADEVAVEAFLSGRITWPGITRLIELVLDRHEPQPIRELGDVLDVDAWTRREATTLLRKIA